MILPVSAGPEHPANPLPGRIRAYRLSLPALAETLVLVVDEEGDPVGWTSQSEPLDSAPALGALFRRLYRLTHGPVAVSDIECLPGSEATAYASRQITSSANHGLLGPRRHIRVLEGGKQ